VKNCGVPQKMILLIVPSLDRSQESERSEKFSIARSLAVLFELERKVQVPVGT
jgi:hypothetical protein